MSAKTIEQQKADKRSKAFKANITKVKPVVVKHIMPSQVMSIYDSRTHAPTGQTLPKINVAASEGSFAASPPNKIGQGL